MDHGNVILRFENLTFHYDFRKPILEGASFSVRENAKLTIMGQNGAGKSTIFKLIMRALKPLEGEIHIKKGVKIGIAKQVMAQEDMAKTVQEFFEAAFSEKKYDIERHIARVLDAVNLHAPLDKKMSAFSGGQKARLLLAYALIQEPDILLLDEPTNDFDVETLAALEDLLDSFAGVLIVISHDRYFLERTCDRFVGLLGNETLRDLPRGVDEYLELRRELLNKVQVRDAKGNISSAAQERLYKKDLARIEKQLERMNNQKNSLLADQDAASFNHEELIRINLELERIESSIQELEGEWLALSERIKD